MSKSLLSRRLSAATAALAAVPAFAVTPLADQPVFSAVTVPGNLALALSVEFPTAVGNAHIDATYNPVSTYLGYFDPKKCYDYRLAAAPGAKAITVDHFAPVAKAVDHVCSGKWSGNFLNWATTQTIDPFRWALTGGYRTLDTDFVTVLQKAYASGQGGTGNFPDRNITSSTVIAGATPLVDIDKNKTVPWTSLKIRIQGLGRQMRFSGSGNNNSGNPSAFNPASTSWAMGTSFVLNVNAKVCDSTLGIEYLEANCKQYGTNYKPEGLIQQYANQIRFSAFGYLNDGDLNRDGGVLRASQKFVGPREPIPGGTDKVNDVAEWSSVTGVMYPNASPDDVKNTATAFGTIENSGVMNYLNKFGNTGTYKTYDPVGELYYATLRYLRNLGDVSTWSAPKVSDAKAYADNFPVVSPWKDPVLYACQKNFVLGIGDVNTHADRNVPGGSGNSEPKPQPTEVSNDKAFDATTFTNYVGTMSGIKNLADQQPYNGCCTNNGALMAGMAYWANTNDVRPDLEGRQTVQTYWVDVLELQTFKTNNQYYLATKYGGATLADDFDPTKRTADLTQAWWHTGDSSDTVGGQLRPDTYFTAGKPDSMVDGLSKAFSSIASRMKAYSTALSTTSRSIGAADTANYAAQFDATSWSGEVVARKLGVDTKTNALTSNDVWRFSEKLAAQLADVGWKNGRFMATYNTEKQTVVPFKYDSLSKLQQSALDTTYGKGDDGSSYLNYLRGDRTNEQSSTLDNSLKAYRNRVALLGDIVNSKLVTIGPPSAALAEASNPGYAAFVAAKADRRTILVTATNAGVVHVIDGSLDASIKPERIPGKELFAYVPGGTYLGPTNLLASAPLDGLAWVGNPAMNHRFLVDGPIATADVDFNRTNGDLNNPVSDWHTIVVGGMGKGGAASMPWTSPTSTGSPPTSSPPRRCCGSTRGPTWASSSASPSSPRWSVSAGW
ncbi:pilus assembly protein [Roseateles chitinivorans]|uniref:pilus assembly protein n=1 Tax=Roseateles chitinivorans TaxID=2917965 RepID=UPI003D66F95A